MKQNAEWIKKRVESNRINAKSNPNYGMKGKKHSLETLKKMSLSAIRKYLDPQERKKTSLSLTGKKISKEHIEKLRISHLGQSAWNKNLKGVMPEPWNKGKKLSYEICKKISKSLKGQKAWNKGKRHSSEQIAKMSRDNSHFWKGGISSLSSLIRKSVEYKIWRKTVFERDNYTCLICGKVGGKINAHHIKSFSSILKENKIKSLKQALNCLELWNVKNGITLCVGCHYLNK